MSSTTIRNNTTELQSILDTINNLPEAGSGGIPTDKPYVDTRLITDFSRFFEGDKRIEILDNISTENGKLFVNMFANSSVEHIPLLDISKAENITGMFYQCTELKSLSLTTPPSDCHQTEYETFDGCSSLENLTIGEGWNIDLEMPCCSNLTMWSIYGIIENLADRSNDTKGFIVLNDVFEGTINEAHLTMLTQKNWDLSFETSE